MMRSVMIACFAVACAGTATPATAQQQIDEAMPASGVVVFQPSKAQLEVVGWARDSVRLVARNAAGIVVELDRSAGVFELHERRAERDTAVLASYTLYVPATATVRVRMQAGEISLRNLRGGVRAGIVEGSVLGDSLSGDVELSSVAGPVELRRSSGRLLARSVAGDVVMSQVTGIVRARSTSGDLTIATGLAGPVEAETYSGVISFEGALAGAGSSFATHSGDIHLRLSAAQDAVALVTNVEGRVTLMCGGRAGRVAAGQPVVLGDGGESFDVITFTGNVRINCGD